MENCIFCKIAKGEINSTKYYEDEDFFIIADISPKAKKHYLMIPKHHTNFLPNKPMKIIKCLQKCLQNFLNLQKS